ncbi:Mediator of RNA polymerase II transcription subunit 29 [Sarcoptes scabiei]|uniref:ADP-ribosylation factor-like protein 2 n=1 Tax=Sarcoptes scabiei TaxID=52283 RepID=A0A131ZV46_SARSC|nr:ADP-ribosylation factor-like protein 2-like protein [Sarcoptes scabiei]UXI17055.1 Mediator of RNA polymerase II transcription subunit 29 [Sarcoptes scabiei]
MVLLSIIKKIKEREQEVRILFLGLDNAGKTTVLKQLKNEDVTSISPTLGFTIDSLEYRDFNLNIWDVGGQKSLRPFWRNYYEDTDGLIFVVDSCDRLRLADCKAQLNEIIVEERLLGASLLILANKQDMQNSLKPDQIQEFLQLDQIKSHHWEIFSCSAITGENIIESIDWLIDDISSRIYV